MNCTRVKVSTLHKAKKTLNFLTLKLKWLWTSYKISTLNLIFQNFDVNHVWIADKTNLVKLCEKLNFGNYNSVIEKEQRTFPEITALWIGVSIGAVAMVTFKLWKGYHNLNCKKKKVVALLDHFHLMFKSERNYFHFRPFDSVTLQCPIWHYMHITSKTKEINSWALDWSLA